MQGHKIDVRTVRLIQHDGELRVDVLRGVGYRADCSCGWRSSRRDTFGKAREDGRQHRVDACVGEAVIPSADGHAASVPHRE